jgi:hypothetical protein
MGLFVPQARWPVSRQQACRGRRGQTFKLSKAEVCRQKFSDVRQAKVSQRLEIVDGRNRGIGKAREAIAAWRGVADVGIKQGNGRGLFP